MTNKVQTPEVQNDMLGPRKNAAPAEFKIA
jgi:hypothetical protein